MQQYMIERFSPLFGCSNKHLQIINNLFLSLEIIKTQRT